MSLFVGDTMYFELKKYANLQKSSQPFYTGVVLDESSRQNLLSQTRKYIPDGWETVAHHMTINLGAADNPTILGAKVSIIAYEIGISDKAIAVKVSGYPSKNSIPHVTIAVNRIAGGKPKDSNQITDWREINRIELHGTIEEK